MAAERADGMPEATVKQEYLCDWSAALVGSVWGDLVDELERKGGLEAFNHTHDNVFTSWDLGWTDSTAVWFWQVNGDGLDLIDHYEAHGKPLSHYYDVVDAKPYRYIKHWLPHDARQTTLSSGVSILNQCLSHWPGQVSIGPDLPKVDGIQAGRWLLQKNVRIHPRCKSAIECLRQYHYEYDEMKKTYTATPAHDWSSHTADAFRYLASVAKTMIRFAVKELPPEPRPVAAPLHRSFTLDQLFRDRDQQVARRRRI
jgi:hypothetical protein